MPFTKFLGVILGCYAVYYFIIVLIDLVKSKAPAAVSSDRKSLHSVQYDLERPDIKSERVTKDTHISASSAPVAEGNKGSNSPSHPHQDILEENNEENLSDDNSPLGQYDLEEERKTVRAFDLEHEEVSEGIEVSEANFNRLVSIV